METSGRATTRRSLKPITDGLTDEHRNLVVRLRTLREACGTSSAQIGRQVHCSAATLSRWLSGESFPDRRAVLRFAQACGDSDPQSVEHLWDQAAAARAQPNAETPTVNQPSTNGPDHPPAAVSPSPAVWPRPTTPPRPPETTGPPAETRPPAPSGAPATTTTTTNALAPTVVPLGRHRRPERAQRTGRVRPWQAVTACLTVAATGYLVGTLSSRDQSPPDPAAAMPTAAHSSTPSTIASVALPAPATSNGTASGPAHHPTTATPPGQGAPARPGPTNVKLGATEASYAYDRPFVFKNQVTGRALEAPKANGSVSQQPTTGTAHQQWKLHKDTEGSQLISVATGQCLRVPPRESDTGVLQVRPCGSDPVADEHWDIYSSPIRGIALRNKASTGCMSLRSPATAGAAVVHYTCSWKPTDDQVWLLLNIAP